MTSAVTFDSVAFKQAQRSDWQLAAAAGDGGMTCSKRRPLARSCRGNLSNSLT
jgi:hypothetical protein